MPDEFCPQCGTPRPLGARACGTCGLDFEALGADETLVQSLADTPTQATGAVSVDTTRTSGGLGIEVKGTTGKIVAYREGLAVASKKGGRLIPWGSVADIVWVVGPLRVPYAVVALADGSPLPKTWDLANSDRAIGMPWGSSGRQSFDDFRARALAARASGATTLPDANAGAVAAGQPKAADPVSVASASAPTLSTPLAFCTACGAPRSGAGRFCASCGHPIDPASPVATPTATGSQADARPAMASLVQPPTSVEPVLPRIRTSVPGFVRDQLGTGEQLLGAFSASLLDHRRHHELRHDKFVLTTERIISYHTGMVHKEFGEMPYRTLTAVRYNGGVVHGTVVVEAASAGMTISRIGTDDAKFCERVISARMAGRVLAPM